MAYLSAHSWFQRPIFARPQCIDPYLMSRESKFFICVTPGSLLSTRANFNKAGFNI